MPAFPTIDSSLLSVLVLVARATALLALAALLTLLLRRASAGTRHLIWVGGLATLLLLPVLGAIVPWELPVASIERSGSAAEAAGAAGGTDNAPPLPVEEPVATTGAGLREAGTPAPVEGRRAPITIGPATALLLLWGAGVLFVLARLGLGVMAVRRIVTAGTVPTDPRWTRPLYEAADRLGLVRAPRLVISPKARMPFAAGLVRAAIVLPPEADAWTDRRRRAVLSHELAHVRRRDLAFNAVAQLACAVWWVHPLVWYAAHRLRVESERACDDLVLGIGTRASEYADHLLQIVCHATEQGTPAVALPMARRRDFEGRMLAILAPAARRGEPSPRHAALMAAAALGVLVPLSALGVGRSDGDGAASPAEIRLPGISAALPEGGSALGAGDSALGAGDSASGSREARLLDLDQPSTPVQDTTPRVVRALLGALRDSVGSVRRNAAFALGQRERREAVTPLGALVRQDPSAEVREMAVWSLAQIGDRRATTVLHAALLEDDDAEVRGLAAWALGQFEDPASVTPLAAAMRDASAEVRDKAAWALGQIAVRPAPPTLVAALTDPDADVREHVAWALGQIRDPETVPALLQAVQAERDADPLEAAVWALGRMEGAVAQDAIIALLEHTHPEVRAAAARYLAGGGSHPWPWPWPMPRGGW